MRVVRVVLILASFFGFLIACGIGFDSQIALGVAGLLALNLVYLFLAPKP